MSRCNYCTLQLLRRKAEMDGEKVTLVRRLSPDVWSVGWVDGYLHPPDAPIIEHKHWQISFATLTDKCVC